MIDISTVTDFQGAFYVLFGGMLISAMLLGGEWRHLKKNKDKPYPADNSVKKFTP